MTLVEVIVAMGIVVTALLALLGEFTTYLHQQRAQRAHAYALRVATKTLEDARGLPYAQVGGLLPTASQTHDGIAYTTTTHVVRCDPTVQSSCQPPAANAPSVARVGVTVSWTDGTGSHHVDLGTADADTTPGTLGGSSGNLTTGATGTNGTSVTLASFAVSPSSVSVDSSNHPTTDVTLTMSLTGLSTGTNIAATWTDDTGTHHATLTNTGGNSWTALVPRAQITRAVSGSSSTVTFAATVPGLSTMPTAALTVVPLPSLSGCHVTAAPIALTPLTRRTSLPEMLSCNASGLTASDTVTAGYASGTSTTTVSMATSDGGRSWSYTLPANTAMVSSGSTENVTFTLTRVTDGYTASTGVSVALA